MSSTALRGWVVLVGLALWPACRAGAQAFYAGFGVGLTRALRAYALLGPGYVLDLNEDDALVTVGAGLRAQAHRLLFFFGEVRLHAILGTPRESPRTILPITLGLGVGR